MVLPKNLKGDIMGVNQKIKERREGFNPNIKGDPAVNVKTDEKDAADVPATEQKDISGKERDEDSDKTSK